ncbi:hypothetical protein BDQ17DRAFT_1490173 [Cyathus striatus]|nr:hypothetical protein BDQ17DRAFT_1490173 [Cyathus striatus]
MPNLWRPLQTLSFLFTSSKRCSPTDLPDYYRTTRQEDYGPNLRHSSRSEYITLTILQPDILDYEPEITRQTSGETLKSGGSQARKNKKINEKCKTILSSAQTSLYSLKHNLSKRKIHLVTRASDDFELDLSN